MDWVAKAVDMLRLMGAHSYAIVHSHVMLHSLDLEKGTHGRQVMKQSTWLILSGNHILMYVCHRCARGPC